MFLCINGTTNIKFACWLQEVVHQLVEAFWHLGTEP